jgi:hypothetical protein
MIIIRLSLQADIAVCRLLPGTLPSLKFALLSRIQPTLYPIYTRSIGKQLSSINPFISNRFCFRMYRLIWTWHLHSNLNTVSIVGAALESTEKFTGIYSHSGLHGVG